MITQAERNAALLAAYTEIKNVVIHFVPAMFQGFAETYLQAHPEIVRNISDACLNAADKVRLEPAPPPINVNIPVPPAPLPPKTTP